MNKINILSVCEKKHLFMPHFEINNADNISLVSVKNTSRSLKKLCCSFSEECMLVSHRCINEKIFQNRLISYNKYSYKHILPITNKLCRLAASLGRISIPFGEIYILASPSIACSLISKLQGLSRIFTIISEEEPVFKMYDELYFKHGALIRHLPQFTTNVLSDAIVINCNGVPLPMHIRLPVVDMSPVASQGKNVIAVNRISLSDKAISKEAGAWGGVSGISMYSLLGALPGESTVIDKDKLADKIFLLDTSKI